MSSFVAVGSRSFKLSNLVMNFFFFFMGFLVPPAFVLNYHGGFLLLYKIGLSIINAQMRKAVEDSWFSNI